jgi:hypothetical protein
LKPKPGDMKKDREKDKRTSGGITMPDLKIKYYFSAHIPSMYGWVPL